MGNKLSQVRNKSSPVRNKSSKVKNMSSIHIQRPIMFLPIPNALITGTFVLNKVKTQYRDKGKQVRSSKGQVKLSQEQVMSSHEQVKYSHSKTIDFL